MLTLSFEAELFFWRGPAPFVFVAVPNQASHDIRALAKLVTYGWGVIPVHVQIGATRWKTSLFPKDGRYLVPIRKNIQLAESLHLGDRVMVELQV